MLEFDTIIALKRGIHLIRGVFCQRLIQGETTMGNPSTCLFRYILINFKATFIVIANEVKQSGDIPFIH